MKKVRCWGLGGEEYLRKVEEMKMWKRGGGRRGKGVRREIGFGRIKGVG